MLIHSDLTNAQHIVSKASLHLMLIAHATDKLSAHGLESIPPLERYELISILNLNLSKLADAIGLYCKDLKAVKRDHLQLPNGVTPDDVKTISQSIRRSIDQRIFHEDHGRYYDSKGLFD